MLELLGSKQKLLKYLDYYSKYWIGQIKLLVLLPNPNKRLMKFATTCLLFSLLLFACRKERINPDEVRLLKTTHPGLNGSKLNTNFEYDNQGRIVRITRDIDNQNRKLIATITYNGNEVILMDSSVNDPNSKITTTVKFLLDIDNKPYSAFKLKHGNFQIRNLNKGIS